MVWVKDKPAGSLICGFEIPQEYKRNAAILPPGDLFLSFSIWTQAGLVKGQAEKRRVQEAHDLVIDQCESHLWERDTTTNPMMKAFHSFHAWVAAEKLQNDEWHDKGLDSVPDVLEQIIKLQDDLFLMTTGMVWSKNGEFGTNVDHHFLGRAHIISTTE